MSKQHCATCNQEKDSSEFYVSHKRRCKDCYKALTNKQRKAHYNQCKDNYNRYKLDADFIEKARKRAHKYWQEHRLDAQWVQRDLQRRRERYLKNKSLTLKKNKN